MLQYTENGEVLFYGEVLFSGIVRCCPDAWPFDYFDDRPTLSFLAAFYSDIDTRGTGTIWSRVTTNETDALDKVNALVRISYKDSQNFMARELVVITWDHVGSWFRRTDQVSHHSPVYVCRIVSYNFPTAQYFPVCACD